jgi:hypothetical protein
MAAPVTPLDEAEQQLLRDFCGLPFASTTGAAVRLCVSAKNTRIAGFSYRDVGACLKEQLTAPGVRPTVLPKPHGMLNAIGCRTPA